MNTHPKQLGKYELQERLGQGGTAEVWKALDPQLQRYVAIKILHTNLHSDSDFMIRFVREAQVIASLRHPNIVPIHDFQITHNESSLAYMVMDYIEGRTLADYISNTSHLGKFPSAAEMVQLFASISLAVDYAHQHGMLHRDIKPSNILLDKRTTLRNPVGEPILTDFGIVKMMGTANSTLTSASVGTPLYISPEQAQGHQGSERSDIYSLGVVLYELATGVPPFQGDTPYALMMQHINAMPTTPSLINPAIPPALDAVILRCLAKDPADRFPKASSLTVALAEALRVPVPEQVNSQAYPLNAADQPTYYKPCHAHRLSSDVSPLPQPPNAECATFPMRLPVLKPPAPPVSLASATRQRQWTRLIAIVALLLILVASGLKAFFLLHPAVGMSSDVGQASFFSSGQLTSQGTPAINDGVQLLLQHIADPSPGNSYYAWLQGNQVEAPPVFLGSLTINHGIVHLTYIDNQHHNLLSIMSNLLITEESASVMPNTPSLDQHTWRYDAAFPQIPSVRDHFSYLDHIRHLLAQERELDRLGLPGGVDFWFLKNIEELQKQAMEVQDHANIPDVRHQITNILYYLDGQCALQDLKNAAPNQPTQPQNAALAHDATVSLLDCPQILEPPGHFMHIQLHLHGIAQAPGATASQQKLADQINTDLNTTKAWLEKVRRDAQQLAMMTDDQLARAQALRYRMGVDARYALEGGIDPGTQQVQPSVGQLCDSIMLLASLRVVPYM